MPKSAQERAEIRRQTESNRQADKDRSEHENRKGKKLPGSSRNPASKINLSRLDPDDDQFDEATKEFHSGSDRVAAIMGAALIENNLLSAIHSCLHNTENKSGLFYDQGAPFGMFSAKITAGRALGLYDEQVEDDLNRIRKIRNEFAHALLSISFENEVIIGICNSIADYVYHVERQRTQINKARLKFERACWTISLGLMIQTNERLEKRTADLQSIITNALSKAWRIPDMNTIVTARLKGAMNDIKSDLGPQKIF